MADILHLNLKKKWCTLLGHSDDIAAMHGEPLHGYYYLICLGNVLEVLGKS